jgi:hypothetical protein
MTVGTYGAWNTGEEISAAQANLLAAEVPDHEAASDPHTGYQKESEKDAASGYAGLTAGGALTSLTTRIGSGAVTNALLANMANATVKGRTTSGTGVPEDLTMAQLYALIKSQIVTPVIVAVSDETTTLTTGTNKVRFRVPYPMTLTGVRGHLNTASTSGIVTVDINENGTTILSTKLTFDVNERTTTTAAIPAVLSDTSLTDDAELSVDIDIAGTGAAGLKVTLLGTRT